MLGWTERARLRHGRHDGQARLVDDGEPLVAYGFERRAEAPPARPAYPIQIAIVELIEIGAGGGCIAWVDAGGTLNVGPRSAGAEPGPACYGRGGTEPTVTDADLIAGLPRRRLLPGRRDRRSTCDLARRRRSSADRASALGVTVEEAARGVIRIANANMVNALKLVSVERGYDPRDFALVAFGGGGGMHAAALAARARRPHGGHPASAR